LTPAVEAKAEPAQPAPAASAPPTKPTATLAAKPSKPAADAAPKPTPDAPAAADAPKKKAEPPAPKAEAAPAKAEPKPEAAPVAASDPAAKTSAAADVKEAPAEAGATEEEGDDDDWENKDESELIITDEKKAGPPGISLRPGGGGGMGGFSSATKAAPGISSSGKKTFDKEFLLLFAPHCTERPGSLPDMEIIQVGPGGEPLAKGGRGSGGGPPGLPQDEWRTASRGGRGDGKGGGKGGGPGADRFQDPRDPRNNQFQRGDGGKGGKGGKGQKGGKPMPFMGEVKPLEETENAWKPLSKTKEEIDAMEKLMRTTKALLNKFAPEKFAKLSDQFLDLEIHCRTDMIAVIDLVFDKALAEPIFGEMYSQLCVRCAERFPEFPDEQNPDAKPHTFKRLLLNKCQEEFEKENTIDYSEAANDEEREVIRKKAKTRMLGNIIFIGELYKTRMLTEKIMHECVIKLLGDVKNPDLDEVECLVKLLKSIGKLIDHPKAKDHMDSYFARIKEMANNMELPNRVRFMLQETMDFRRGGWDRRKPDPAAKAAAAKQNAAQHGRADARDARGGPTGRGAPPAARPGPPAQQQQQQQQQGQEPSSRAGGKGSGGAAASKPAAAAPSAEKPPLTAAQVTKRIESSLEEYLFNGDLKEFLSCLDDLKPLPEGKSQADIGLECVQVAVPKVVEARTEEPRDRVALMLGPLFKAKYLESEALQQFFTDSLEFLEDEVVDVPHIAAYTSKFIAHAIAAGVVPLSFLPAALEPLVGAQLVKEAVAIGGQVGAAYMMVTIITILKGLQGDSAVKSLYEGAAIDLKGLMPEGAKTPQAVASLLDAAGLSALDPQLMSDAKSAVEASAKADQANQLEQLEAYLMEHLGGADSEVALNIEELTSWISANCSVLTHATLARVVMRCTLETATTEEPPPAHKAQKQIERCKLLLIKYTASGGESAALQCQAACLYEVQAFCGRKNAWSVIKKLFYNLYETDIVFEDAYSVWREDVSDETPGKDKALFQVNEFLQWLAEAAEEDGED